MNTTLLTIAVVVIIILLVLVLVISRNLLKDRNGFKFDIGQIEKELQNNRTENTSNINSAFSNFSKIISQNQNDASEKQNESLMKLDDKFHQLSVENEQKLENIRQTIEVRLKNITEENNRQIEKMRDTVDEKLQQTLETRISQSFKLVSERLEQVYKGLGEMKNLAEGVGDLKKVLANVKNRGVLGESQLSAILEEFMTPEQYDVNVATKPGSKDVVEFAIKMPGDEEKPVYLPIDAKFPGDTYTKLVDALESGDNILINEAKKNLANTIKNEAKDIHSKYIYPPYTTQYAIMFLPFEGLYAEVLRLNITDELHQKYRVTIAGPTTISALLSSIQMGFRTLALQKHSDEVWKTLGEVKSEFDNFGVVLEKTQDKIRQTGDDLDKLIGVRTRAIQKKLRNVEAVVIKSNESLQLGNDEK